MCNLFEMYRHIKTKIYRLNYLFITKYVSVNEMKRGISYSFVKQSNQLSIYLPFIYISVLPLFAYPYFYKCSTSHVFVYNPYFYCCITLFWYMYYLTCVSI